METWEVWDIEESTEETNDSEGLSKLEVSISEEDKYSHRSTASPCLSRSQSSRASRSNTRLNSTSELEDSIGFTSSYTLDEPGKEKKHVLLMSNSRSPNYRSNTRLNSTSDIEDSQSELTNSYTLDESGKEKRHVLVISSSRTKKRLDSTSGFEDSNGFTSSCIVDASGKEKRHSYLMSSPVSDTQVNSTNGFEDSNGFTSSYTLDEPGKEKKHVLVVSGMKKATSSNEIDTAHRSKSFNGDLKNKINKNSISKSFNNISDDFRRNNKQTNLLNMSTESGKKSKSIFDKAKSFFKSPELKKTTSLINIPGDSSRSRKNSSSLENSNRFSSSVKIDASGREEKHVLKLPNFSPVKPSKSLTSFESSGSVSLSGKDMSSKMIAEEETRTAPGVKSTDDPVATKLFNGHSPSQIETVMQMDLDKKRSASETDAKISHSTSGEGKPISRNEYVNISIATVKSPSEGGDKKTQDSGYYSPLHAKPEVSYDITFKPEKSEEIKDNEPAPMTPFQKNLMSLVVGVGLGEEDITKDVVNNIVHPHSVEEHGKFKLGANSNGNVISLTNGDVKQGEKQKLLSPFSSDVSDKNQKNDNRSLQSLLSNIHRDDLLESSQPKPSKIDEKCLDEYLILPDLDYSYPKYSTPKKEEEVIAIHGRSSTPNGNDRNQMGGIISGKESPLSNGQADEILPSNKPPIARNLQFEEHNSHNDNPLLPGSLIFNGTLPLLTDDSLEHEEKLLKDIDHPAVNGVVQVSKPSREKLTVVLDNQIAENEDKGDDNLGKAYHLHEAGEKGLLNFKSDFYGSPPTRNRRISTDSLASFEHHEREFTLSLNGSATGCQSFSPSPNKKNFANGHQGNDFMSPLAFEYLSSREAGEDEVHHGMTDEMIERCMTSEMLRRYMPPIEETPESSIEKEKEPSPTQFDQRMDDGSEVNFQDECGDVYDKAQGGSEPSLTNDTNDMGGSASHQDKGGKVQNLASQKSSKKSKKKKKKKKSKSQDDEKTSELDLKKIWIYHTDASENSFHQAYQKIIENENKANNGYEIVHMHERDPEFLVKDSHNHNYKGSTPNVCYEDSSKNNASDRKISITDLSKDVDMMNSKDNEATSSTSKKSKKKKKKKKKKSQSQDDEELLFELSRKKEWIYHTGDSENSFHQAYQNIIEIGNKACDYDIVHMYGRDPDCHVKKATYVFHNPDGVAALVSSPAYEDATKNNATDSVSSMLPRDLDGAKTKDTAGYNLNVKEMAKKIENKISTPNLNRKEKEENSEVVSHQQRSGFKNGKGSSSDLVFEIPINDDEPLSLISDTSLRDTKLKKNPKEKLEKSSSPIENSNMKAPPVARKDDDFDTNIVKIDKNNNLCRDSTPKKCLWYDYNKDEESLGDQTNAHRDDFETNLKEVMGEKNENEKTSLGDSELNLSIASASTNPESFVKADEARSRNNSENDYNAQVKMGDGDPTSTQSMTIQHSLVDSGVNLSVQDKTDVSKENVLSIETNFNSLIEGENENKKSKSGDSYSNLNITNGSPNSESYTKPEEILSTNDLRNSTENAEDIQLKMGNGDLDLNHTLTSQQNVIDSDVTTSTEDKDDIKQRHGISMDKLAEYDIIEITTKSKNECTKEAEEDKESITDKPSNEAPSADIDPRVTNENQKIEIIDVRDEEDDERDSGTELRYDDIILRHDLATSNDNYGKWLESIKPLLYDAELVANLFLRLANKYCKYKSINQEALYMQQIHSAQMAYDVIKNNNIVNFASVISFLLSYLGAIKVEHPPPKNVNIPNILIFLEQLISRNTLSPNHISLFTCLLTRPNNNLTKHHELRVRFIESCFRQEVSELKLTNTTNYHIFCFLKISDYFVQLDTTLCNNLTREFILPYITDQNSTTFVMDVLTHMGLVISEESVSTITDLSSALVLLDFIFKHKKMPLLTTQKLYAFIQLDNPKFRFCDTERQALANTLKLTINF